jgi:ribosomal protein L29
MSSKNNKVKLKDLTLHQLNEMVNSLKKKIFSLRMNAVLKDVADTSVLSKTKKEIARVMTEISMRTTKERDHA